MKDQPSRRSIIVGTVASVGAAPLATGLLLPSPASAEVVTPRQETPRGAAHDWLDAFVAGKPNGGLESAKSR